MEINPWGVLVALLLLFLAGALISFFILILLAAFNVIRIKKYSTFIFISFIGSVFLNIIFWGVKCRSSEDGVITVPEAIIDTAK